MVIIDLSEQGEHLMSTGRARNRAIQDVRTNCPRELAGEPDPYQGEIYLKLFSKDFKPSNLFADGNHGLSMTEDHQSLETWDALSELSQP